MGYNRFYEGSFSNQLFQEDSRQCWKSISNRHFLPCFGLNEYFEPNNLSRSLPNPIHGPAIKKEVNYDRNYHYHGEYHMNLMKNLGVNNSIILEHTRNIMTYIYIYTYIYIILIIYKYSIYL